MDKKYNRFYKQKPLLYQVERFEPEMQENRSTGEYTGVKMEPDDEGRWVTYEALEEVLDKFERLASDLCLPWDSSCHENPVFSATINAEAECGNKILEILGGYRYV